MPNLRPSFVYLYLLFLSLGTACSQVSPSTEYRFDVAFVPDSAPSISIDLGDLPQGVRYTAGFEAGTHTWWLFDLIHKSLIAVDIQVGSIRSQHRLLPDYPNQDFYACRYVGPDSVFVILNSAKQSPMFSHDSVLLRLNLSGEILEAYPIAVPPLWTSQQPPRPVEQMARIGLSYLHYAKGRLHFTLSPLEPHTPGDTRKPYDALSLGGHVVLRTGEGQLHPLVHPAQPGVYFPSSMDNAMLSRDAQGNSCYLFGPYSQFSCYDVARKQLLEVDLPSKNMPPILPLADSISPDSRPKISLGQGRYGGMGYIPSQNVYLRYYTLPSPDPNEKIRGFVMADSLFRAIGEGLLPDNFKGFLMTPYAVYQIVGDISQDASVQLQRGSFTKGVKQVLSPVISHTPRPIPAGLKAYLEHLGPSSGLSKGPIVFFPVEGSCPTCVHRWINLIAEVQKEHPNVPFQFILGVPHIDYLDPFSASLQRLKLPDTRVILDTTGQYQPFFPADFEQGRLMLQGEGRSLAKVYLLDANTWEWTKERFMARISQ